MSDFLIKSAQELSTFSISIQNLLSCFSGLSAGGLCCTIFHYIRKPPTPFAAALRFGSRRSVALERFEEALGHSVVPAVTSAGHTLHYVLIESIRELFEGVLHALTRVEDHPLSRTTEASSHTVSPYAVSLAVRGQILDAITFDRMLPLNLRVGTPKLALLPASAGRRAEM